MENSETVLISHKKTQISLNAEELNKGVKTSIENKNLDVQISKSEKETIIRPIIPYNPFSADFGDIKSSQSALLSFSQIIDGRMTSPPMKKNSYIKNVQVINATKKCIECKANLNRKWKVCPICGNKN